MRTKTLFSVGQAYDSLSVLTCCFPPRGKDVRSSRSTLSSSPVTPSGFLSAYLAVGSKSPETALAHPPTGKGCRESSLGKARVSAVAASNAWVSLEKDRR